MSITDTIMSNKYGKEIYKDFIKNKVVLITDEDAYTIDISDLISLSTEALTEESVTALALQMEKVSAILYNIVAVYSYNKSKKFDMEIELKTLRADAYVLSKDVLLTVMQNDVDSGTPKSWLKAPTTEEIKSNILLSEMYENDIKPLEKEIEDLSVYLSTLLEIKDILKSRVMAIQSIIKLQERV